MKRTIPRSHYEAAYNKGRELHASRNKGITKALKELSEIGINPASASNYIYNLRQMLRGECYQRAMSVESTDDFLGWIFRDYQIDGLRCAVSALEKHIPYFRKSSPSPMAGHIAVLEKYRDYLDEKKTEETGLDDLVDRPTGNNSPDRAERIGMFVRRDQRIREFVVKRAKGKCEFCLCEGFILPSGARYVEAHHIIALADSGFDTLDNVIALCPSHHREAHFGANAATLEAAFITRLAEINGTTTG
jgi:hypothetical protein